MKYLIKKVVEYNTIDELMRLENGIHIHEISITPYDLSYTEATSLTPKQKELFELLHSRKDQMPSLDEMRKVLKVGSINTVVDRLTALEKKGYIQKIKHSKRFYKLLK